MSTAHRSNKTVTTKKLSYLNAVILIVLSANGFCINLFAQEPIAMFRDEFDKAAGTAIDPTKWTAEIGGGGLGNEELQFYTESKENAFHDGTGSLAIKAIKLDRTTKLDCWYGKCQYTSARV